MITWIILAAIIVIIDQLAKLLVIANIGSMDSIHIIPGLFDFVYVENTGAAFSILSENTVLLSLISVAFCLGVCIFWYIKKPKNKLFCTALTMLFAGALGNAIDRIFRGFVVDFIYASFITFPVFNIADIAITCGAAILIIYMLFFDKDEKDGETDSSCIKPE